MASRKATARFVAVATGLATVPALGAGFALNEHSGSGMGNAYAGAAAVAEDASTVFFNPAGMSRLDGRQLSAAAHYIHPDLHYTDEGSLAATGGPLRGSNSDGGQGAFVPNLYFVQPISDDLTFGLGVTAPFGFETRYDDDWVGRYHAVHSHVRTINVNPSIAWRVSPSVALGAGYNWQKIDVELSSAVDMGAACLAQELGGVLPGGTCASAGILPQQTDGFADLQGDSVSWGYNLGVLLDVTPRARIGLSYRSAIDHHIKGPADFTVPGEFAFVTDGDVFVDARLVDEVTLPATFAVSFLHQVTPQFAWLFDWTRTRWSSFAALRIDYDSQQPDSVTTEDWRDSSRFSLGINYRLDAAWLLRAGFAYDDSPVPNAERRTPRVPDNDRRWVALGTAYAFSKTLSFDFGYAHLFVNAAHSNNAFESAVPTLNHTLVGRYEFAVDIVSVQLNWRF
jgi:long-chain fatty acid transport protein